MGRYVLLKSVLKMVNSKKYIFSCNIFVIACFNVAEELNLSAHKEVKSSFQKDYEKMVMPMIEEDVPCYILFR